MTRSIGRQTAPPAIVVGLDCITGLQTARILAARGVPVIGISQTADHYCARTRAVTRVISGRTSGDELIETLIRLGPELERRAVLFPCSDASVLTLARHRARLVPWYSVMLPTTDVVEMLMDKLRFQDFGERIGLPVPQTRILGNRSDAERAATELPFPCILKPAMKTPRWEANSPAKVHRVAAKDQLLELYDRYAPFADELMVQQWIDGTDSDLYSCNCYFDGESTPLVTFVARKLRQWPPRTGTSCLGEECRNDEVLALTLQAFGAAGYQGLGYLEVKRETGTGRHYVIEANVGRPTGRSAIAEAGGVDLLYTMYCDAVCAPLPSRREQRYVGARWIYWKQDIRSAFYYWRQGELTLLDWIQSWRGRKASAVWSWSDPIPALAGLASDGRTLLAAIPRRLITAIRSLAGWPRRASADRPLAAPQQQ